MQLSNKLFNNKKLRAVWDKSRKTWWVSVIDVIAALRNTDYDTARNHWKQIKYRKSKKSKALISYQLKLPCKDGKQRATDVMRYKDIIRLIQSLPAYMASGVFRLKKFIGELAAESVVLKELFTEICVKPVYVPPLLQKTVRKALFKVADKKGANHDCIQAYD